MKAPIRGGPAQFEIRRQRALDLANSEPEMAETLQFLASVLSHQQKRVEDQAVREAAQVLSSKFDLEAVHEVIETERKLVADQLAANASSEAGREFLDHVALAPIVELAASQIRETEPRKEPLCPFCQGEPKVSVIVEESGDFMQGAARYLICGRCATPWGFTRAMCPKCGEHHPDRLGVYTNLRWPWARIDGCDTCGSYLKTFDLREPGSAQVVSLIDDVATLALDLWAQDRLVSPNSHSPDR